MKKVKSGGEEIEFFEEGDIVSLYEKLFQAAGRRGVSERVIEKTKKKILKLTKKEEKLISKGKPDMNSLRNLYRTLQRLEDIAKDPSSYTGPVITEILKSI